MDPSPIVAKQTPEFNWQSSKPVKKGKRILAPIIDIRRDSYAIEHGILVRKLLRREQQRAFNYEE